MQRQMLSTDILFATLLAGGRELASLRLTGVSSFGQVVAMLRAVAGQAMGPAVIKLRNFSQGWAVRQPLLMRVA